MAMLPIFMIGFIVGVAISYTFYVYKKDVPSDVKIRMQEEEIIRQKDDNNMLEQLNKKLYEKIDKLEHQLNELKNK